MVVMDTLIDVVGKWLCGVIDARGNNTYQEKIADLRSGYRGSDSKIMSGLLNNKKSILKETMCKAERSHWRQR